MDIERDRRRRLDRVERARLIVGADVVGKLHRGRIAGVARYRFGEQIGMIGPHARTLGPHTRLGIDRDQRRRFSSSVSADRTSVVSGKSGSVLVDPGGRRIIKKKTTTPP